MRSARFLPGFSSSTAVSEKRLLERRAAAAVDQVVEGEDVLLLDHVGPGRVDLDLLHVGDDQQRRVVERALIELELLQRRAEVLALALVLPGEAAALPHVGPAVAAAGLRRALLEGVPVALRIGLGRRLLAEHAAQVDEVLLRPGALLEARVAPLADEILWRHGCRIPSACSWRL